MARSGTNGGDFYDVGFGAGVGDDLFDHIEDLLDFPGDDVLGMGAMEPCIDHSSSTDALLSSFPPALLPPLPGDVDNDSLDASNNVGAAVGFGREEERNLGSCDEIDMAQLEWMSNFFDESDSFSFDIPSGCNPVAAMITVDDDDDKTKSNDEEDKNNNGGIVSDSKTKDDTSSLFRTLSPTSVLENSLSISGGSDRGSGASFSSSSSSTSSSSSSSEFYVGAFGNEDFSNPPPSMTSPDCSPDRVLKLRVHGRPRSKRSRPAALWAQPQVVAPVPPPSFEPTSALASSDPESFGESCSPPMKKKKKKKATATALPASAAAEEEDADDGPHQAVRKCMHCEITKTPQWRAGPMGPKTLCNACGVRYKSGRLFPEYRPAASPTFVPSIHSNSHKKVVEMRLKAPASSTGQQKGTGGLLSSCDLLEYIRRR